MKLLKEIQTEIQKNMDILLKLKPKNIKSKECIQGKVDVYEYIQGKIDAYQEDIDMIEKYLKQGGE